MKHFGMNSNAEYLKEKGAGTGSVVDLYYSNSAFLHTLIYLNMYERIY